MNEYLLPPARASRISRGIRSGIRAAGTPTTPALVRLAAMVVGIAVLAWVVLLRIDVSTQRTGLTTIGTHDAPVVTASADLYTALNDMDAQQANVLLVGRDTNLGFTRGQALTIYEQRRAQADRDVQHVATAAQDPATQRSIRALLDGIGAYEAYAAQADLLDQQAGHHAGQAPPAALAGYRAATDLLKATLLPVAQSLIQQNAAALNRTYAAQRTATLTNRTRLLLIGCLILVLLLALQLFLARRFHRMLNPRLALATVLAVALIPMTFSLQTREAADLRVAKQDAFDSVLALSQARAIGYDLNADESRYLLDGRRATRYQQEFLDKSQSLVRLPDATLATYDQRLAQALQAYRADNSQVGWSGFFGSEFRNITFAGERSTAEQTLQRYQIYQRDDRQIRRLVAGGDSRRAIAFCASYHPDDSNYAFSRYDTSLAALITINQHAFSDAIRSGERRLRRVPALSTATSLAILVLLIAGIRCRTVEYRPMMIAD